MARSCECCVCFLHKSNKEALPRDGVCCHCVLDCRLTCQLEKFRLETWHMRRTDLRRGLLAVICAVSVPCLADTWYWLPAHGVAADATDLNNWSIGFDAQSRTPVADAHPAEMPTSNDVLCATRDFNLDFGGKTMTFKSMDCAITSPYTGETYWGANGDGWTFANGSLEVGALVMRIRTGDKMLLTNDMHISCLGKFTPGQGMGADGIGNVDVTAGCSLSAKTTYFSNGRITIAEGGTFTTESLRNHAAQNTCLLENRGAASFGEVSFDSSVPATYGMTLRQLAGTMTFGGTVSRNGRPSGLALEISGGAMRMTGNVSFDDVSAAAFTDGAEVEVDVDDGCSVFMGDFTYAADAVLKIGGKGELRFGVTMPSAIVVIDGGRHMLANNEYGNVVTVMSGGELCFNSPGASCASFDLRDGAKCSLDLDGLMSEDVILRSESEQTLQRVMTLLEEWIAEQGAECRVERGNGAIVYMASADGTFDAASGASLDDPSGWASGTVPSAGSGVEISGSGVAELTPSSPSFGVIRVASGATLKLVGGSEAEPFEMPTLHLAAGAALTVASGSYVRYAGNTMVCRANADSIPVLTVESGATLYAVGVEKVTDDGGVAHDITFRNVDMRLNGTIVTPIADSINGGGTEIRKVTLRLGYAESGETSYFAFTGDGGTIFLRNNSWVYKHADLRICCVEPGGVVETPSSLVFKDVAFPQYNVSKAINALFAGIDNTLSSNRVRIEADGTVFDISDTSEVGGNVDMVFSNGGTLRRYACYFLYPVKFTLSDTATLKFGEGCELSLGRCGNGENPGLTLNSTGDFTLDGGILQPWIVKGAHRGTLRVRGNSRWNLADFMCNATDDRRYAYVPTPLFSGFRDVVLEEGSVLDFMGVYDAWKNNEEHSLADWGRSVSTAENVPLTGAGSIRVNNLASNDTMTVTVCCPTNTATGTAEAVAGTGSTLRFADGSNWAGTVLANGCAELFNADGSGTRIPSKATFASIRFAGSFPICVWKENGETTGDQIDIGSAVTGNGAFTVVARDEAEFLFGDGYDFGTYPADASLPSVSPHQWRFESRPDGEGSGRVVLRLVYRQRGLRVTIR